MHLDLTGEQTAAPLGELDRIIESDRYFLSPRIQILKEIRAKIKPYPPRETLPTPKPYEPPQSTAARHRRR
jgi:hypothetical protein